MSTDTSGLRLNMPLDLSQEDAEGLIEATCVTALLLAKTTGRRNTGTPGCWFGGKPRLPEGIRWPIYTEMQNGTAVPLHFLVQLNLSEIPRSEVGPNLADHGTIFVFFDPVVAIGDQGYPISNGSGISVIYSEQDCQSLPERDAPQMPFVSDRALGSEVTSLDWTDPSLEREGVDRRPKIRKWPLSIAEIDTYGPIGGELPVELTQMLADYWDEEEDYLAEQLECDRSDLATKLPTHLHALFAASQRVSKPVFSSNSENGASEGYTLLLSISNDPDLHFFFPEGFGIGIWIPTEDIPKMKFDRIVVWENGRT